MRCIFSRCVACVVSAACAALAFSGAGLTASGPNEWAYIYRQRSDPNFSGDYAFNIRPRPGGGFIMTGSASYLPDPSVTRLNDDGTVVWSKWYPSAQQVDMSSIWLTSDGGVILAGRVAAVRGKCCDNNVGVMKLDADGGLQWNRIYLLDGHQDAKHIQQVGTGANGMPTEYVVVGETDPSSSKQKKAAWILRLNADGSIKSQTAYGPSGKDASAYYALPLEDGGLWVTGTTQEVKKGSNNSHDLWLFKLDRNGTIVWQKAFPTKGSQFGKHLHPIPGGGAIVLAEGTPDGSPSGAWALRVNGEGETAGGWQKVFSSDRPIRVTGYSLHTLMNHTMPDGLGMRAVSFSPVRSLTLTAIRTSTAPNCFWLT